MLNRLVQRLNGHSSDPAALAGMLDVLGRQRQEAQREVTELRARRRQALLDDAPDATVDKLERAEERARLVIEKLDLAEPDLRRRLAGAQTAAREAAEPGFSEEYSAAFSDYVAALRSLAAAHHRQDDIRERARKALGDARANVLLPPFVYGGLLTADHIEQWIARNTRELATSASTGLPMIAPPPIARRTPPARPATLQHSVRLGDVAVAPVPPREVAPLTAARRPDDEGELAPGEARVRALRDGWSPADDRPQCHAGQVIRMTARAARDAERVGAVEIIEAATADSAAAEEARP